MTQPTRGHLRGAMFVSVCAQSALVRPRTYSNTRFSSRRIACLRGDALVRSRGRTKKVQITTPPRQKYLSIRAAQSGTTREGMSHKALTQFTRPHTILGTIVSVSSVTMMAWQFGHVLEISSILVAARQAAQAVVAAVLMNVSIVGINQVYDKKLDRVNKPYLPMASGAFSSDTAISIIAVCTALSFMVGLWSGSSALMWALLISLILGIVYSVDYPGLRWKKSPFLAASCVLFVRAVIVQLGFFAHALGRGLMNFNFPVNLWCAICFMTVYGIVIALFKDLPDMEGDVKQNVRTLSVRLGPSFVFNLCLTLLSVAYVTAIVVNLMHAVSTTSLVVGAIHSIVIITLLAASRQVNVTSSASLYDFYIRFIWRAFYLEYFLLPFFTFV